jgi:hypothetical protein
MTSIRRGDKRRLPKKKKNKDKEKKRSVSLVKAASPPPNTANVDPQIEAAFNYCKLGKYPKWIRHLRLATLWLCGEGISRYA